MINFWDYSAWGGLNVVASLLISLLVAHMLKRSIPLLQASLIPASVLGGGILVVLAAAYKAVTGDDLYETAFFGGNGTTNLELITYHALAIGFIASSFKTSGGKLTARRTEEIFNTGVTTVATYLVQAVLGFGITIVYCWFVKDFFPAAGLLLPFGYGQGTGQAMNYGNIYETTYGFVGGKTFGLTVAAMGFIVASLGGVVHLNILRRKGKITPYYIKKSRLTAEDIESENEIPMQESVDKITIQVALVVIAYVVAFCLMKGLSKLVPGMKSVIFGFNFLLGVLSATLIRKLIDFLHRRNIIHREYVNDFLMTRISNFSFDIMVVAGIAAIRLSALKDSWFILLVLGIAGAVVTYIYIRYVCEKLFPDYAQEQFLAMYGMLTGTASTGVILLREIDGDFQTPAADNMVYQNFPAIVFGLPIMMLATLAPQKPYLTFLLLCIFLVIMNVILFRKQLPRKK